MELKQERLSSIPSSMERNSVRGPLMLRQAEAAIIRGYAACVRSRIARMVTRPVICMFLALLIFAKAVQLARFISDRQAVDDGIAAFSFWAVGLYYALTLAFVALILALYFIR